MSGKKVFVSGLQEGQQVRDLFLIARKNLAETKAGKPYMALTLMDRTGEIEARVWENALQFDAVAAVGEVIVVQAMAKSYQNQLQLGVSHLQRADEAQVALADFMPASKRPVREMQQELSSLIATLSDKGLQQLLSTLFSGELLEQFSTAPAAKKMHHAYIGGLLEHTLSVTGMAVKAAEHYPGLDRDMLVAGALVHDIAKTREFSYKSLPFDYTDCGRLVGHLVLGADMVRQAAVGIDGLGAGRVDQLVHLVLSHHGRHEFGAPVLPMTPEAILLHHLDDMDAKMNYIDQLREKQDEPGWSDYQRPLERFLYLRPLSEGDMEAAPAQTDVFVPPAPVRKKKAKAVKKDLQQRQQTLF
ncbi:MAG: 3'-5' exoribonuclease YhaM family protein [Desulfobulbaceae bacterium]|nr:3'-5' exoribonuclease YhaM family protein [Desulfobulbaceae bacterium]